MRFRVIVYQVRPIRETPVGCRYYRQSFVSLGKTSDLSDLSDLSDPSDPSDSSDPSDRAPL